MRSESTSNRGKRAAGRTPAEDETLSLWVVLLLGTLCLVPIELSLEIGSIFLPWYRLILLLATIPMLLRAFGGGMSFQSYDKALVGLAIWVIICALVNRGASGIEGIGSTFAETITAYLLIRIHVRTKVQIVKTLRLFFALMIFPILASIPEAVNHVRYVHDFGYAVTGFVYRHADDVRLGLLRAESTFQHPILFGLFCSSFFLLSSVTAKTSSGAWMRPAFLFIGCFMAVTSSALLSVTVQIILVILERMSRGVKKRVPIFLWGIAFVFAFLSVASNRGPFAIIANTLSFNGGSAYFRILQYGFAKDDIMKNPIFGFKAETWTRPFWMNDSIDNNWLLFTMNNGIPGLILIMISIYLLWRDVYKRKTSDSELTRLSRAWLFTLVTLVLTGATVAFFGKVQTLFYIMLAIGGSLALVGKTDEPAAKPPGRNTARAQAPSRPDAPLGERQSPKRGIYGGTGPARR
jgi:O-antigen ligase